VRRLDDYLRDMPAARAFPPKRPSACAALLWPSSVTLSSISPVAMRAIMTARAFTSAGRFSLLVLSALLHSLKLVLNVRPNLGKKRFNLRNLGVHFSESGLWRVTDPHLLGDQPLQLGLLSLKGIEHINCCLCHVPAPMLCAKAYTVSQEKARAHRWGGGESA
jgi:hypothetical protein